MKKLLLGLGIVGVIAFMIYSFVVGRYNSMVQLDQDVKTARGQVETEYQRRMDLIPGLVSTVQGYANFEKSTLQGVIDARSKATQTNVNINDAESFAKFQESQGELSSALSRLMMVVENYPDLKANTNFMDLQAQLEGTANSITYVRKQYNEKVSIYNKYIKMFPSNVVAGFFKFMEAQLFKADEGAEKAPDINFGDKKTETQQTVEDLKNQVEAEKLKIELEKTKQELNSLKGTGTQTGN